jgi:polyisoprenoid-binding protein YceI
MERETFRIIAGRSSIDWIGRKVTGSHNGTIAIKEGTIALDDERALSGRFIVDTTSITILDIIEPVTKAQFAGHLASEDFFAAAQYPEAMFVITSTKAVDNNTYLIEADLTIKGITQSSVFNAQLNIKDTLLVASGKIIVDRTKYDMKFRSESFFQNLGDNLIYNDFELEVNITAEQVTELQPA